jgi:predicted lysophospholipase L1 biosynthesis ABC-type transport system permease subunit
MGSRLYIVSSSSLAVTMLQAYSQFRATMSAKEAYRATSCLGTDSVFVLGQRRATETLMELASRGNIRRHWVVVGKNKAIRMHVYLLTSILRSNM